MESAKLFEKSGTQFNLMEAAGAYEDAFKAYNMAKQHGMTHALGHGRAATHKLTISGGSNAVKMADLTLCHLVYVIWPI